MSRAKFHRNRLTTLYKIIKIMQISFLDTVYDRLAVVVK